MKILIGARNDAANGVAYGVRRAAYLERSIDDIILVDVFHHDGGVVALFVGQCLEVVTTQLVVLLNLSSLSWHYLP